ncbi:TPA_asm: fiber [Powellomyces chytrid fungus MELD virus 1]|nr:TPA_asm: fiber [Powellomyces chytrid fungus MELD virus 1]
MPLPNSVQGQYTVRRNFQVLDNLRAGTVKANNVKGDVVENIDGVFFIRDLITPSEKIHIAQDRGIYEISIDDNTAYDPLFVDDTNTIGLRHDGSLEVVEGELSVVFPPKETLVEPLIRDFDGIKLQHDETMKVTHGMLGIDYQDPLYLNMQQKFSVDYDQSLTVNTEGQLAVVPEFINNTVIVEAPLQRRVEDSHIVLNAGKGLQVNDDGELQTDLNNIIKPLGALHANGLFDLADDFLEYGYEAIDEIFGDGEDTEVKLLRLKTSSDFTQKGLLSGSKVLAIKNKGANRIPYYATISDEFDTDDTFRYNSTLNELHVGHVSLNTNFNPDNNEAVTAGYAEQLYQSETGSPIDVSALSNGRRTLGLRTDATLAVTNQVLGVNVTPLVNGSSIKIDANGKIASGLIFQPANGVRLREGTNNDVQLALEVEGALEKVGLNKIKEVLTFGSGLQRTENAVSMDLKSANSQILVDNETGTLTGNVEAKPNSGLVFNENILDLDKSAIIDGSTITVHNGKLTGNLYHFGDGFSVDTQSNGNNTVNMELEAGEGIEVTGNRISATGYTAGDHLTISGRTISAQIPDPPSYSGGAGISVSGQTISNTTQIRAGAGITIFGSNAMGWTISSQNLKQNDDDDDEKRTDNEDETLRNENNEVVQSTSPVSTILPFPLIPFPPPPPVIPLVPIFPFIGLLPTLLGTLGGFAVIFGYQRKRKKKQNPDGTDMMNEDGTPVFDTTPGGEWIWSEGSNVAIQSDKTTRLTRLLMDDWPEDVKVGYWASVMNLSKTWEFFEKIVQPWTIDTVGGLIDPINTHLTITDTSVSNHDIRLYEAELSLDSVKSRVSTVEGKVSILETQGPITVGKGLVKNSNIISINPYQSETISAIGDVVFGMQRWVPSTVFFTDSEPSTTTVAGEAWGNGSYTISTSHTDNVNRGHKAFAQWGTSTWFTNVYTAAGVSSRTTSTTAGGISYAGEWLQIQLPAAKCISAVRVRYRDGGDIQGCPQTFAVVGSNDGSTWNLLYHQSTPVGWTEQNRDPKWFNMTTSTAYSYHRFVCLTNGGNYAYCGVRLEYFTPLDSVTINKPLFIGNRLTGANATFTKTVTAEGAPTIVGHLVNRTFTDTTYATITALTSLTTRVTTAESSLTGKQNLLSMGGGLILTNNILLYDSAIIASKTSVDSVISRVSTAETSITTLQTGKQNLLSMGGGLILTNNILSYDSAIIASKTSVDSVTSRVSTAETSITTLQTGKQNLLLTGAGLILANNTLLYDSAVIASKSSVDALSTSKQDVLTAGTGLTKTEATLSVNASQPQITSVGTLTALSVNGYINITNTGSVALSIADNVSFGRCGANTQWFSNAQTGDAIIRASGSKVIRLGTNTNASIVDIFDGGMVLNSGNVTVATAPTLGNHLVNKTYVDVSFASIGSLTTTNTNVTNLTGRVVSLETGGTTSKENTVWSKIKGSDTVPVPLPPVGGAALTGTTTTVNAWEYLNGTYNVNHSTTWSAGYEAWRGFTSANITNP